MQDIYRRMSKALFYLLLAGVLVLGAAAGCDKKNEPGSENELVILCGSSFVGPMKRMCEEFTAISGVKTVYTVGGSEDFLPLVKAGRKGDILITHDPYLDYVRDADMLAGNAHVGFVAPVLAVQKGNPKDIKSIEDLTRQGLKVALTDPEYSTCGEMVFALLEKKGIKEAVLENVGNRLTKGHSTLGTFLKTEAVDAVIMWNGVADTFKESLEVVDAAYEYEVEIGVYVIGLNYSKHTPEVERFVEFAGTRGREIFAEHGYIK